jgi:hypothetical protein
MKAILFLFFIAICTQFLGQKESILRTDGIYIFDNDLDYFGPFTDNVHAQQSHCIMVPGCPFATFKSGDELLKKQRKIWNIDFTQSTFLTALIFTSDSTGQNAPIGSCRVEEFIRERLIHCLNDIITHDLKNHFPHVNINDLKLLPDSTISFQDSLRTQFKELYSGKVYGDSLILKITRTAAHSQTTFTDKRKYVFYSYGDIFNCSWIYRRPSSPIKD